MTRKEIQDLFERYSNNQATPDEQALIESWYLRENVNTDQFSPEQLEFYEKDNLSKILSEIKPNKTAYLWPKLAAAAILITVIGFAAKFYLEKTSKVTSEQIVKSSIIKSSIHPGRNKATITLSDGSTVSLNDVKNGVLAKQGKTDITKTADGQILYKNTLGGEPNNRSIIYNVATTPKGGQYQFVLADGTKVWLNASSSIRFPVEFHGAERKVEITGEAYFEVAHNAKMPFRVVSGGQTIEVLGTHFNVNAYADEQALKTTLLEGSVKVSAGNVTKTIKPGEQARLFDGRLSIAAVNVEQAVAWKDGYFIFQNDDLKSVMRQISRWYDIDVNYDGTTPERRFSGSLSRMADITQFFEILNFKKINYKVSNHTVTITP